MPRLRILVGFAACAVMAAVAGRAQPVISAQPQSLTVNLGDPATFTVTATSSLAIGYQWQFNGVALGGQVSDTLSVGSATEANAGTYTVYVYDTSGGVTSTPATLTVNDGPTITSSLSVSGYAYSFPFYYTITTNGGTGTFSATGLPPGLTLDPTTGVISGTPTAVGTYDVQLAAIDLSGVGKATLVIKVTPPPYVEGGVDIAGLDLSNAAGIARSPDGQYYVSDSTSNSIVKVDPASGTFTAFAGNPGVAGAANGSGSAASFNGPTGLAVDAAGNLYVADTGNSTIRMVTPQGAVSTLAGTPGEPGAQDGMGSAAHFNYPTAVAVDSSGNVFVMDTGNRSVRKIAAGGIATTFAGGGGTPSSEPVNGQGTAAIFQSPISMAIGPDGSLYLLDGENFSVVELRKISPSGLVTSDYSFTFSEFSNAPAVAVDASGNVFVTSEGYIDGAPFFLSEVTASGSEYSLGPVAVFSDFVPAAIAVDPSGQIYGAGGGGLDVLSVGSGPAITSQPQSAVAVAGQVVSFSVSVSANPLSETTVYRLPPTVTYQLYFDGEPQGSPVGQYQETTTMSFPVTANTSTVGTYSILVTGPVGGSVMSDPVTLTLGPDVSITVQPVAQSVAAGSSATFSVTTGGGVAPAYQWTLNGAPIAGATSASYTVTSAEPANSGSYAVVVSDATGGLTSQPAFLTIAAASGGPSITFQPDSLQVSPGQTVVLSVGGGASSTQAQGAGGPSPRTTSGTTYQWFLNGAALSNGTGIAGSSGPTLILSGGGAQSGSYVCLAENGDGSTLSQPAVLTQATATDVGHLTNVSCRALVGTGAGTLITGFALAGGSTEEAGVLVRASGPSLSTFDVGGLLADPKLQLYDVTSGTDLVASNSGWGGSPSIASEAASVGAFTWTNTVSLDSALLEELPPGSYTANVSGASNDTGVALTEIYSISPDQGITDSSPQLVNLSARVSVGTGSNILIVGFVIGGSTSETVLIRGSGPALSQFGVPGVLPDPELQLFHSNADGTSTLLGSNTGWGGDPEIAAVAQEAGAFSWGPSATPDSAILLTLPPGDYTAQVSGTSGDTGVALVEVYALH